MNENLRTSHDALLAILDSLDAIVSVTDIQTYELLFLNKDARHIFGDGVGKLCWQVLQKNQTKPCNFCSNSKLISSNGKIKEKYVWEFQNPVNDHWYDMRDRAINWIDGRIVRIQIATDITNRKRYEETLRKSDERLKDFINSATDAFVLFDLELNIIHMNKTHLKMFHPGMNDEDLIGKNLLEIVPNLKETGRYKDFIKVIETGSAFYADDIVPLPKFGDRYLSVKAFKISDGLGTITRDITVRKQAEEQRNRLVSDLKKTLSEVKTLRGFLPICSHCKKIRDDKGYWNQIEAYIQDHSDAEFSHSICQECAKKYYPDIYDDKDV